MCGRGKTGRDGQLRADRDTRQALMDYCDSRSKPGDFSSAGRGGERARVRLTTTRGGGRPGSCSIGLER